MKFCFADMLNRENRRSPYGERGLKFAVGINLDDGATSLPVRGAWIEIGLSGPQSSSMDVAPRTGSVD